MLFRVVMLYAIMIVLDGGAAHVGGSGNGASPCASADHLCFRVVDCQVPSPHFFSVSLSQKRKWTGCIVPSIAAIKLPVAGLSHSADIRFGRAGNDGGTRKCCGIACRFPQKAKSPSESARA